jgi:hypothetical protein
MQPTLSRIRFCVALVALSLLCGAGHAQPAPSKEAEKKAEPAGTLKVANEAGKEVLLSPQALGKLPRLSVKVKDHRGNPATYEGVALGEVLRSAGVTLGKDLRGPLLANYLLVEAGDGYRVVFALPEVDPDMTHKVVLLADRKDGKQLDAKEGPYRVVVPDDKRNMRWVKQVVRISVRGAAPPAAHGTENARRAGAVTLLRVPEKGIQPQVAVDAKGIVHMIYFRGRPGGGDVFYVRSDDFGAHFSAPLQVNSQPGSVIAIGTIRGAHLALGKNGRVHVAWMGSGKAEQHEHGHATPMLYSRLNDHGTAFEPQRNVIHSAVGLDGGGSVAADDSGNVYVAWHAPAPGAKGEETRRVWVARSTDEGKTFAPEEPASEAATGACGCCGMRAFGNGKGNLYVLYRSAAHEVNRDTYLLASMDQGSTFQSECLHKWSIRACPMSSFALAAVDAGVVAAWETEGQVYFARVDPHSGKRSEPVSAPGAGRDRKHPVVAGNARKATILAWTEGTGWERGGAVAWQVFDKDGRPTAEKGRTDGVPTWSSVAVFARPDGGFTVVY